MAEAHKFIHQPVDIGYDNLNADTTDNGRFYDIPDGSRYPSITTVMSHLSKNAIDSWKKRVGENEANRIGRIAASRGTSVHELMESYINNEEIDVSKLLPHHKVNFLKLAPIMKKRLGVVYGQELPLYSHHLGIAGRADVIGKFDNVNSIVDFKNSSKVKKKEWISSYFMQGAGYGIMFEELTGIPIPNIVIVMAIDGKEPIIFKEHRDNWVRPLINTIKEYHKIQKCKTS